MANLDMNRFLTLTVTLIVGVILIAGVLIPVINDNGGGDGSGESNGVKKVVAASGVTWVLTEDGKLFGCGKNDTGSQGDGTTTNVTEFTQRLTEQNITDFDATNYLTWAITEDGKLFGCGRNNYGQQGDGTTDNVTEFTQRLTDENIESVICSTDTTWALTADGKLFGCGRNDAGQQGDGTTDNVLTFTQRLADEIPAGTGDTSERDPVMTTMLSVIPLIMFVGLILLVMNFVFKKE